MRIEWGLCCVLGGDSDSLSVHEVHMGFNQSASD
jgi:hypothetical protein